ncbi:MAG: hypothetical protein HUJ62_10820 [Streptococcus gallolyticus]|nr:hypothetical protein [Streptococcus gallolyticus]
MKVLGKLNNVLFVILSAIISIVLMFSAGAFSYANTEDDTTNNSQDADVSVTANFDTSYTPIVGEDIPSKKLFSNLKINGANIVKTRESWLYSKDIDVPKFDNPNSKFEAGYYYDYYLYIFLDDLSTLDFPNLSVLINGKQASYWYGQKGCTPGFYYYKWIDSEEGKECLALDYI